MYRKVRELNGIKKRTGYGQNGIHDRNVQLLTEPEAIRTRWKEYVEELYKYSRPDDLDIEDELYEYESRVPDIIESKVEWALKNLPIGKAVGVDNIPIEMMKVLQRKQERKLCNYARIYMVLVYGPKIF